jgi:hypothetical protein
VWIAYPLRNFTLGSNRIDLGGSKVNLDGEWLNFVGGISIPVDFDLGGKNLDFGCEIWIGVVTISIHDAGSRFGQ